jgi:hypothetical protein
VNIKVGSDSDRLKHQEILFEEERQRRYEQDSDLLTEVGIKTSRAIASRLICSKEKVTFA